MGWAGKRLGNFPPAAPGQPKRKEHRPFCPSGEALGASPSPSRSKEKVRGGPPGTGEGPLWAFRSTAVVLALRPPSFSQVAPVELAVGNSAPLRTPGQPGRTPAPRAGRPPSPGTRPVRSGRSWPHERLGKGKGRPHAALAPPRGEKPPWQKGNPERNGRKGNPWPRPKDKHSLQRTAQSTGGARGRSLVRGVHACPTGCPLSKKRKTKKRFLDSARY